MGRVIGFNDRLRYISKHGRLLRWVVERENAGVSLTYSQTLDHCRTTEPKIPAENVLSQLIDADALILDGNMLRVNGPVASFILWASDSSTMMPGSRIEQLFSEVFGQAKKLHEILQDPSSTLRQKEAHIKERGRDMSSKLLSLRGSADENVRTVITSSSSLRLLKEEDRFGFIAKVSKLWEEDIDPISEFRDVSSSLQFERREIRNILESISSNSTANQTIRKEAEKLLEQIDFTWDRVSFAHDVMIKEVRPLYKLVQQMKTTISIVNSAENLLNHIITANSFNPSISLGIPSIRISQLFNDLSIDSFVLTLADVQEESEYKIPARPSTSELLEINPPLDIMVLLDGMTMVTDAMEFVIHHPFAANHTLQECAVAVYSSRKNLLQTIDRDSPRKIYSKENSEYVLESKPVQLEVVK
jgi:hypothetical protein